ncbi:MAG: CDP-alcohol phosphatidyltransferase family protein [Verrucomicrobiota bacterium]
MKRSIPFLLTTLRLLLGPLALAAVLLGWSRMLFAPLLLTATLSDIYDGVLARRFGVSTAALRRYDSVTDVIYYLFILLATWLLCRPMLSAHWAAILALVGSEIVTILTSLLRFRVMPATHSYMAKFYGLCLFACFVGLLTFDAPGWTITALAVVGVTTNTEIIAILCLSKRPPVDVPSLFVLRK